MIAPSKINSDRLGAYRFAVAIFSALTAASAALMFSGMPALAADIAVKAPPPPVYSWTGFYIGLNGGGIWGQNNLSSVFFDGGARVSAQTLGALAGSGGVNGRSAIGGVQAGYNWQGPTPWVVGVEADIQGMSLNENRTSGIFTVTGQQAQDFDQVHHDWLATFRGRAGYTVNRALLYVTGGLAVGDMRFSRTQTWDFGDGCPIDVQLFSQSVNDSNMDMVRVGINYRFGAAPVVAKY